MALRLVGKALIETISWHVPVARTGLAACRSTPRGDSQQAHDEVLKEGADWIKAPSEDPRRDDLSCEVYDDAAQRSSFSCATGRAPVYKASQSFLSKPPGPGRSPPPTSIHRPICQPCLVYTLGVKEERIPQRLTVFFFRPLRPLQERGRRWASGSSPYSRRDHGGPFRSGSRSPCQAHRLTVQCRC